MNTKQYLLTIINTTLYLLRDNNFLTQKQVSSLSSVIEKETVMNYNREKKLKPLRINIEDKNHEQRPDYSDFQ